MRNFTTLLVLFASLAAQSQIRLTMVDPISKQISISNYGAVETSIATYRFCSLFEYVSLNQAPVTIIEGDLSLAQNETVTVQWASGFGFNNSSSDLGLYLPTGSFSSPAAMVSFFEYGAGQQGRENVAVSAGYWSTNTFLTGTGPWYYIGNGTQQGAQFWSAENPNGEVSQVVINEVDCDTEATDVLEFIELYGEPNASLNGLVLVLFNGGAINDISYEAFDLDGFSLNEEGFFVAGSSAVPNVGLVLPQNTIQNGADAVTVYEGNAADWPNGTAPSTLNLMDALVYATSDADDTALLAILTPGQPQVNETQAAINPFISMSRIPDGGAAFNSNVYWNQQPTPGNSNVIPILCSGGAISLDLNQLPNLCVEEPNAPLSFTSSGDIIGEGYFFIAVDASNVIVRIGVSGEIDFNGLPTGTYTVWGLAFNGAPILDTGIQLGAIVSECLALSANSVTVTLASCVVTECEGGIVTANGGSSYFSFCIDGNADIVLPQSTSTAEGSYTYVLTNTSNLIVSVLDQNVDFDALPVGSYRIWGLSYFGELTPASISPGNLATAISTNGACVQLSSNFVQVVSQTCTLGDGCAQLFISEYTEGLGNNKALEIYNPTSSPVNLAGYGLYVFNNGSTVFTAAYAPDGILQPGETFVVSNGGADPEVLAIANGTSTVANFNGNDAVQLRFNDLVLDVIGVVGENPGTQWTFGSEGSTLNRALVRKQEINAPTTNWLLSTGQWNVYPASDLTHIGNHSSIPCSGSSVIGFTTASVQVTENDGTIVLNVQAFNLPESSQVTISVAGGTALPDQDFVNFFPLVLDFPFGSSIQSFDVTLIDDTNEEGTEFIQLSLEATGTITYLIQDLFISIVPNDPVYEVYDIAEITTENLTGVMDSLDVFCELRGIVHGINFNASGVHFHLIDETDGIKVFSSLDNFGYVVNQGDSIHVRGLITQFMGQAEMRPDAIDLIDSGHPLFPPEIVASLNESHESHPVTVECVMIAEPLEWTNQGNGFFVRMSSADGVFVVRVDGDSQLFDEVAPLGHFTLTGLVEQADPEEAYDSGYTIWPSFISDISNPLVASFASFADLQFGDLGASVDFVNTSIGASSSEWDFGDGSTSAETNPSYLYGFDFLTNNPEFEISLVVTDGGTCADTLGMMVTALYVGVYELAELSTYAYPNPTSNDLTVKSSSVISSLIVRDSRGRIVLNENQVQSSISLIPLSQFPTGLYHVQVETENGRQSNLRVIKE